MNHIQVGELGEQAATEFLEQANYQILARKYRSRMGEIDIIAKHNEVLVFVEVKTRRSITYGWPAEAVNYRKQQKIINTALCYLKQTHSHESACRFDVIEILLSLQGKIQYNHIMNAFER